MELFIFLWFLVGFIVWAATVLSSGYISVEDVLILPAMTLCGVGAVLLVVFVLTSVEHELDRRILFRWSEDE